jgi:hypothetical protein
MEAVEAPPMAPPMEAVEASHIKRPAPAYRPVEGRQTRTDGESWPARGTTITGAHRDWPGTAGVPVTGSLSSQAALRLPVRLRDRDIGPGLARDTDTGPAARGPGLRREP